MKTRPYPLGLLAVVASLSLTALANVAAASSEPPREFAVPSDGTTIVATLTFGASYQVEASGTYQFALGQGSGFFADAAFSWGEKGDCHPSDQTMRALVVNGLYPWTGQPCDATTHTYRFTFSCTVSPNCDVTFRIMDDVYGDNSGSLGVKILQGEGDDVIPAGTTCFPYNPAALTNGCVGVAWANQTQPIPTVNPTVTPGTGPCVIGYVCGPGVDLGLGSTEQDIPFVRAYGYLEATAACGATPQLCRVTLAT